MQPQPQPLVRCLSRRRSRCWHICCISNTNSNSPSNSFCLSSSHSYSHSSHSYSHSSHSYSHSSHSYRNSSHSYSNSSLFSMVVNSVVVISVVVISVVVISVVVNPVVVNLVVVNLVVVNLVVVHSYSNSSLFSINSGVVTILP
jgi:hypothetical protein